MTAFTTTTTLEMLTSHFDAIASCSYYDVFGSTVYLTIDDFEGAEFDGDAVTALLGWLAESADSFTTPFHHIYHFGDAVVHVGWTSMEE